MDLPILLITISLPVMLILSVPIGVAIGLSVALAVMAADLPVQFLMQKMFFSLDAFPLLAVPFFIMAGEIMQKGSMAESLLKVSRCLIGHITGGLAHVSVLTCMFYGALSGSGPATVAAVGGIMIPSMEKEGFSKSFSTATNVSAGCLGVMIPPSVPLIIYGTTANVSVGDLFIAGIVPGIFIGIVLMITCYFLSRHHGFNTKSERATFKETMQALSEAKYALLVPIIVLGGIYGGITTPTEAGAIAVTYAFIVEGLVLKKLTAHKLWQILRGTTLTNATIFLVVATASALGQILLIYNVPDALVKALSGVASNPALLLFIIIIMLLILGTFMDALANILILTPLLQPLVVGAGIDMTHFGIIMIATVSLGFLTPPVGVNLFVGCGISGISIERLSYAVLPFIFTMLLAILVLAYVPAIVLCLL
ncbi:MAG: TRAP transporter large permease [Desulfobacterales bacterium]|jgi:C4-dicarboxylate transporter DctM subunit|nr:TRAP transporter large permease [Desulfobacterales bacterium]